MPGDPVVGFITRGQGISVHRADCPNYLNSLREDRENRWIHVDWADTTTGAYSTTLRILARDRNGLVLDIATVLSTSKVRVSEVNSKKLPDNKVGFVLTFEVDNVKGLEAVQYRIRCISGVLDVRRGQR